MINRLVFTRRMFSNILCVLALCLPMFRYYNLGPTGLAMETIMTLLMLAICLVMFYMGMSNKHKVYTEIRKSQIWFGLLIFWLLLITCIYEIFTEININNPNADYTSISLIMIVIRAVVIGYLLGGDFDYRDIFKIYSFLVTFIIAVYVIQWGMVAVGFRMSFQLPFLPLTNSYEYLKANSYFGMDPDPTSLFSERAHLAEYLVPYIAVCLFGKGIIKKKALLKAVIVSVVVLTTVSATGIVVTLIEWGLFFAGLGQKKSKFRIIYLIAGAIILIAVYYILRQVPTVDAMFDRLFIDNTGNDYSSTKADYRIYRGFDLFTKLPLVGQIFGIGYNHMQLFASIHNIVSEFDNDNLAYEFFSTIFQIAIYSGYIGIVCAVKHIYHLFKSNSPLAKALIIIMLAMWCSSAMFLTNSHIVMVMLIIATVYYDNRSTEVPNES